MKVLAVDAGNSRIKWGLADEDDWIERGAVATGDADALESALAHLTAVDRILVTNVAGETAARAIRQAVGRLGIAAETIVPRAEQCGVKSGYAAPEQLGPDRWAALIGARTLFDGPCVVVNAGTTMTVDALSGEGVFLGGFIVPGYAVMRGSLATSTDRLKLQHGAFSFFPDNTGDAIASGALNALAGAVDRMVRYMVDVGEGEPLVMLSGGDANLVAPLLSHRVQVVDNLVLEGLRRIGAGDV
ncbi:MAG TPA: type III pantothenate kinase [Burkholderiales bacterium]|nr:type III pantothenate kinase [Burkholderiales bacterium]